MQHIFIIYKLESLKKKIFSELGNSSQDILLVLNLGTISSQVLHCMYMYIVGLNVHGKLRNILPNTLHWSIFFDYTNNIETKLYISKSLHFYLFQSISGVLPFDVKSN